MLGFADPRASYEAAVNLQKSGRFAEAEAIWRQMLTSFGDDAVLEFNLGQSCFAQKNYAAAEQAFRRAEALQSGAGNLYALGCTLGAQHREREAIPVLKKACRKDSDNPRMRITLGNIQSAAGETEAALKTFRDVTHMAPDLVMGHFNCGNMLVQLHRQAEAEAFYRKTLQLDPNHAGANNNMANVLMQLERPNEAVPFFEAAIRLNPRQPRTYVNLGYALYSTRHYDEAVPLFREALSLDPDYVRAWDRLGLTLQAIGKTDEAISAFTEVLKRQPDLASARFGIGSCYQIQGDFARAHQEIRQAIAMAPDRPFYWNAIVMTKTFRAPDDPDLAAVQALAAKADSFSGEDQARIYFMLGKIYSDLQAPQKAFTAWRRGNRRMHETLHYQAEKDLTTMVKIRETFSANFLSQHAGEGVASDVPVFIIGMPRSGTSLVEQILASHSAVYGAGELPTFSRLFAERVCGGPPEFKRERITPEAIRDLGQRYLAEIRKSAPEAQRITDKMPGNFSYAGLIHLALPQAKIIHVQRDPRDCCLSCYSKQFVSGQPFTYDLTELGHFYRGYQKLMAHWHSVLPQEAIMDVQYEDLVADFDHVAPKLLKFCGLDWQESCRDFYKTKRIVRTASQAQVHKPLYSGSIGRWHHYEAELAPLIRALNDQH